VVALTDQFHRLTVKNLQHLIVGGELVRVQNSFARDGNELGIQHPVADPAGAAMEFVTVIGR
jgi:hypothetical protein